MKQQTNRYGKFLCAIFAMFIAIFFIFGAAPQVNAEENSTITIYYDNSDSQWSQVNIHYWGTTSTTWPGVPMESAPTADNPNIYKISIPTGTTGVVFNSKNEIGRAHV